MVGLAPATFIFTERLTGLLRFQQGLDMEIVALFAFLVVPTLIVGLIMILMGEW
jgi:hypothetical protein